MRTTVDLPDEVHRAAMRIAHARGQSRDLTIAALLRSAMRDPEADAGVEIDPVTGLPIVRGRLTAEDGAAADE